jgi:hypothetical protein
LFVQVLMLCRQAGLVTVGLVSLDGTKVKANASRHKAMSYEYMKKEEERLQKEIAELLSKAESTDAAEDDLHGREARGDELPADPSLRSRTWLARRESRLAKIQEAKKALEKQALEAAQAEEARRQAEDDARRAAGETPRGRRPVDSTPDPKAQRNFTDPESKIMKVSNLVLSLEGKGFDQCGNAQIVCNEEQIIVAADVTDQANDKRQVQPMVRQAQENLAAAGVEEKIEALDADSGYYSEETVAHLESEKIDPYIATERLKHHEKASCASDPDSPPAENLTPKERMARKLRTRHGRETYAKRKGMIEPILRDSGQVFGQIKQVRGFRQFLLRGLAKMRGEWLLICLTHNLKKLFRKGFAGITRTGSGRWAVAVE